MATRPLNSLIDLNRDPNDLLNEMATKPLAQTPNSAGLLDQIARQKETASHTAGILNNDIGGSATQFNQPNQSISSASMGMSGLDPLNAALKKRTEQTSNNLVGAMKRNTELQAPALAAPLMQQYAQNQAQVGANNLNNYKIMQQQKLNETSVSLFMQQQNDNILASILGVLGSVGGAILGGLIGGPVGAAIGAGAGGKAGGK